MYRGPLAFAALVGTVAAQRGCPDCAFDLRALEEFSVDFSVVMTAFHDNYDSASVTTQPPPEDADGMTDHGTFAVHARNLQLKLDNHFRFPDHMPEHARAGPLPLAALAGVTVHEELHINGLTGQASFHLGSPALNLCLQVDHLPPVAQLAHDQIEQSLQQAEQIVPEIIRQYGGQCTMDGTPAMALQLLDHGTPLAVLVFDANSSAPLLVGLDRPNVGLKFDNYVASVGDQFSVRACEVETHSATQSMMAADPESREFIASRIAEHQQRLQALLEPAMLNTRFNFIPLELADQMIPPAAQPCITNDLAQIPSRTEGTFQTVVFSVCSFVMGMATLGALHKKRATPAEAYYQVSA